MTPADLRATLSRLGLGQSQAARLLGVDPRTMRRWIAGDMAIPGPAERLLGALQAGIGVHEYLDGLDRPEGRVEAS